MSVCPICQRADRPFFQRRILGKYDVVFYFCDDCRFLHSQTPYWLDEAYSDAIVRTDTGIVRRNLESGVMAAVLFKWMFAGEGKYIDIAGGSGLFTRLMRDMGFDCYWSDKYASNVFARGFEADVESSEGYRAATAFEVLEHVENPLEFIREVFGKTRCEALLLSTLVYPGEEPPDAWWYYGLQAGQHISFCHLRTLQKIAAVLNLKLYSQGEFHLFSRIPLGRAAFRILTNRLTLKLTPLVIGKIFASRIQDDHEYLMAKQHAK